MLKTTPSEVEAIRHIIETHCANCDEDGNCILLDDGETHRCVQRICMHGIHCNYFKDAVLPAFKTLHEEIMKHNNLK